MRNSFIENSYMNKKYPNEKKQFIKHVALKKQKNIHSL